MLPLLKSVLIIESNLARLDAIKSYFLKIPCKIFITYNVSQAKEVLYWVSPDIIIIGSNFAELSEEIESFIHTEKLARPQILSSDNPCLKLISENFETQLEAER